MFKLTPNLVKKYYKLLKSFLLIVFVTLSCFRSAAVLFLGVHGHLCQMSFSYQIGYKMNKS